jgi:hypothetical protein
MQAVQWTIAAVTTIFVALVAFLQWRTAQQKAMLDLFDQRHEIYEIVRNAVGAISTNSLAFDQAREIEFMQTMERAYFFFGDDVVTYLEALWRAICEVRAADATLQGLVASAQRGAISAKRADALKAVMQFHSAGKPLFARYMRFPERVPMNLRRLMK